jgi:hypothetical protein
MGSVNDRDQLLQDALTVNRELHAEVARCRAYVIDANNKIKALEQTIANQRAQLRAFERKNGIRTEPLPGETAPMVAPGVDTSGWWARRNGGAP